MYSTMNTRGGSARHTRRATGGEWRALAWLCRHPGWLLVPALLVLAALRWGPLVGRRHARRRSRSCWWCGRGCTRPPSTAGPRPGCAATGAAGRSTAAAAGPACSWTATWSATTGAPDNSWCPAWCGSGPAPARSTPCTCGWPAARTCTPGPRRPTPSPPRCSPTGSRSPRSAPPCSPWWWSGRCRSGTSSRPRTSRPTRARSTWPRWMSGMTSTATRSGSACWASTCSSPEPPAPARARCCGPRCARSGR